MLRQEDRKNLSYEKKSWLKKKNTSASFMNQDRKKIRKKSKRYKIINKYPSGNITKLNKVIYAGAKLMSDKIGIPQGNTDRNSKPGLEIRLELNVM